MAMAVQSESERLARRLGLTDSEVARLSRSLEAGRVPSTITDAQEAYVQTWLAERHGPHHGITV